jgi:hypothetical protein
VIDKAYLQDLLAILKIHGVSHIKMQGLELSFGLASSQLKESPSQLTPDNSTEIIAHALKKQEEAMPPDLRADNLMDQDKILNWSSPDQKQFDEEPELPLTGEQPL